MNFNRHFELEGKHAILSASSWRWLNDDQDALVQRLCSQYATTIGTILHDVARKHIKHRIKLHKYDKNSVALELLEQGIPAFIIDAINFDGMFNNLMNYVNDGIMFKMQPEVVLYYSKNFFGTADAIMYSEKDNFLRIHDFKSGVSPTHMEQLLIYAALFSLEYRIKPKEFDSELRIYQNGEVVYHEPSADEIMSVVETITTFDKFILRNTEEV